MPNHVVSTFGTFDKVGYKPHEGQRQIHEAKATKRFRVVVAGRRTGKSTAGGHELTVHAYEAYFNQHNLDNLTNRMEYWIVGPEYTDSEKEFRSLYNDLVKLQMPFDHPGTYYDANGGNMHISLWGGKFQVHAKSAKYPNSLVGEGLNGVILAEAAKLKASIWPKFIRPMLIDQRGWALMSSTPEGKNWLYDQYMRSIGGDPEYWSIRMPSHVNDILFPLGMEDPEFKSLVAGMTDESFKQEIMAEFTEFVGRVFKNFDEEIHCRPLKYNPTFETYACVDYGWSNPMVWLLIQVDHWDNVYVIGEYYAQHMLVEEAAYEIKNLGLAPDSLIAFYPDPAGPEETATLEKHLKVPHRGNTGGEIKTRIDLIRKWLKIDPKVEHLPFGHKERQPKIFIDPVKCPNTVREFNDYRYPENKSEVHGDSENPMKKDDHTPEALGRFFAGHFGRKETAQRSRQRGAKIKR